jgi:hypothetical protein
MFCHQNHPLGLRLQVCRQPLYSVIYGKREKRVHAAEHAHFYSVTLHETIGTTNRIMHFQKKKSIIMTNLLGCYFFIVLNFRPSYCSSLSKFVQFSPLYHR